MNAVKEAEKIIQESVIKESKRYWNRHLISTLLPVCAAVCFFLGLLIESFIPLFIAAALLIANLILSSFIWKTDKENKND